MKLLDKLKDLFTDEEEEIVEEVETVRDEEPAKLPTFMRNKLEEEEKNIILREEPKKEEIGISDREVVNTRKNSFSFPVDMEEDYSNTYVRKQNRNILDVEEKTKPKTSLEQLYAKKEEPKPTRFKPTPVISPVYGVLDKNYTKDEVKIQDSSEYEIPRTPKKVDFESVHNKAYGTLTDDIRNNLCENCELYKEVKITKAKKQKDDINLLEDMTEDVPKEDVSIGEAAENYYDFGVDYEPPKASSTVVNADKVEIEVNNDIKIINHNDEEPTAEKIEVKEEPLEIPELEPSIEKVPTRKSKKEESKKELTEEKTDDFEDTKEFEKISKDEENIEQILNDNEEKDDIPLDTEANDIFNLIDSMYDEEEEK